MNTIIPRVGRAIDAAIRAFLGDTGDWLLTERMDHEDAERFRQFLACAAINALNEPTEEMEKAGAFQRENQKPVADIWRAMQKAALIEKEFPEDDQT